MAMKLVFLTILLVCSASPLLAAKSAANPLDDVVIMLGDLQQKAIKEGEMDQKTYAEFSEFCEERAGKLTHQVKTGKDAVAKLEANIQSQTATIEKLTTKIEDLAGAISSDSSDLKDATGVREKEHASFLAEEKELIETIDMLKRAIGLLEKKTSMLQVKNAGNLVQTFSVMVQASLIGTADAAKLTAFVQNAHGAAAAEESDDSMEDAAFGAPTESAYESKSGSIVDTLEDLTETAETQLETARSTETDAKNNYDMMKQSLGDEVKYAEKDMEASKKGISSAQEEKSGAEGELAIAKKDLETHTAAKRDLKQNCYAKAQAFETEVKNRDEELAVIGKAKQILKESIEGASLTQLSFVQVSSDGTKAARFVRDLGRKQGSSALVQLAARISSVMRSAGGEEPFHKVKVMITNMIGSLEKDTTAAAEKKAYCDKELAETGEKKTDTKDEVEELDTKGDRMESKTENLKDGVGELEGDLSDLTKTQAEMDKLRAEEKAKYGMSKEMIERSLSGTQRAIKVLKDYFAQDGSDSSSGVAGTIITLLENCESKFSSWLADVNSDEESAVAEYTEMTQENEVEKAAEETDLENKEGSIKRLKVRITETHSDESTEEEKLKALEEYQSEIKHDCIAKPQSHEQKMKRLHAEIAGLKEALRILEEEAALVQVQSTHTLLRGTRQHGFIAA